ncbi:MAG: hypothetical protein ACYST6_03715 [Planctomycetota bacterium]
MGLFRKRLDVVAYWKKKAEYLFSDDWVDFARLWREQCGGGLETIPEEYYLAHFRGAGLQLIGIVISRCNVSRDRRYELRFLEENYIKDVCPREAELVLRLYQQYNSAFGSSLTDGVRPMAQVFAESMDGPDTAHVERFFYDTFYTMIRNMLDELRDYKLK